MPVTTPSPWLDAYHRLLRHFGPQHWWPGKTRFEVMVGAVLTQNTAWNNVEKAIANLYAHAALDCRRLLALDGDELATLIRPAGYHNVKARRLKALCTFLATHGADADPSRLTAQFALAELRRRLLVVNGIGDETADAILLYALDQPSFVVDAYTRRSFTRLGLLAGDEDYGEIQRAFHRHLPRDASLYNEFHALIVRLGKDTCRPQPRCAGCPLADICHHDLGRP